MTKYTKHTRYIERELIKCPICHGGLVQEHFIIILDSVIGGGNYGPYTKAQEELLREIYRHIFFERYCENMSFWQTEEANHETN